LIQSEEIERTKKKKPKRTKSLDEFLNQTPKENDETNQIKKKTKQNYVPTKINRLSDYREGQIKIEQTQNKSYNRPNVDKQNQRNASELKLNKKPYKKKREITSIRFKLLFVYFYEHRHHLLSPTKF